ncbi:endonuclease domain-containing protein [uncultured Sphingomonas sp.]|uniref:endonuclease domain-containing protein n=1 Tax=uncultured Sphingomonas sp. TaxID=158754 RepID=UPI0035CC9C00
MRPPNPRVSPHASRLRRERTKVEERFWQRVRDRRLDGYKFRFQSTVGPFVADFLCVDAKLIVELDGSQHNEIVDARRTAYLERCGYRVLRFWNNDVSQNMDGVLTVVLDALRSRAPWESEG